jgi:hypothetical protein
MTDRARRHSKSVGENGNVKHSRLAVIALGVIVSLWSASANAAALEQLVMPGPVIEGHAKWEGDCSKCHSGFVPAEQKALCLDCHEAIRDDVTNGRGLHGQIYRATPEQFCKACHTEHKGRGADIVGFNRDTFDHSRTDFALRGAHTSVNCSACHEAAKTFRDAPSTCVACHRADEPHQGRLGDRCDGCHADNRPWTEVRFDHSKTAFPLLGAHETAACKTCHVDEEWKGISKTCNSCHEGDDVHRGARGTDCGKCHDTRSWSDATFDHLKETGFALVGHHAQLACSACHLDAMARKDPPKECFGCHSADDVHSGRFGTACGDCHNATSWKKEFDHKAETGYALLGAHAPLDCARCHRGALTDQLPNTCEGCHTKDDPHQRRYQTCSDCHSQATWHDVAFDHGFTRFPLIGIHASAACEACHTNLAFTDAPSRCVECHRKRDPHHGAFGLDCDKCHNPNGWNRWQFDHDAQTTYPLTGKHRGLECALCHKAALPNGVTLSRACIGCHRSDDAHDGSFGPDCGRCHTTESFLDSTLWKQ